jgi:YD repeat-containing protein
VYASHRDFFIPGPLHLVWDRSYSTELTGAVTPLGPGWTTKYFTTLERDSGGFRLRAPEGGIEVFEDPHDSVDRGGVVRHVSTCQEITRRDDRYIVTRWDVDSLDIERFEFAAHSAANSFPLVSISDVVGMALDLSHDGRNRLTSIRQRHRKRTLQVGYTSQGRIGSLTIVAHGGERQVLVKYEYDSRGMLRAAYDARGNADRYEYDPAGRLTREIHKDGSVYTFDYDGQGRCTKTSGLDNYDMKLFRYFDQVHSTQVTDSVGAVTLYQWLPTGQVVREVTPVGGEYLTEYDEHGRIISETDPRGGVARYEYDQQGNRCTEIDQRGNVTSLTFNGSHQPETLRAADGSSWKNVYDGDHRLTTIQDPAGGTTTLKYDRRGNLASVTLQNGSSFRHEYSETGDLLSGTDWDGNKYRYRLDFLGRVVERINPLGQKTVFTYDLLGNLLGVVFADGSRVAYRYDVASNRISSTDGNGHTTHYRVGPCGRLLEKRDPSGNVVKFLWGTEPNRLEGVINEKGEVYALTYDLAGRIVARWGSMGEFSCLNTTWPTIASRRPTGRVSGLLTSTIWPGTWSRRPCPTAVSLSSPMIPRAISRPRSTRTARSNSNATCSVASFGSGRVTTGSRRPTIPPATCGA